MRKVLMASRGVVAIGLLAYCAAVAGQNAAGSKSPPEYRLSLQYEGAAPSSPAAYQQLYDLGLNFVESSQFNSGKPQWNWDLAEILADYRRAVDGRYLLISYSRPHTITTMGGDISVREIVIGLNGSQYASSLHTVDAEGRIIGHSKYSGELGIKLQKLVISMSDT